MGFFSLPEIKLNPIVEIRVSNYLYYRVGIIPQIVISYSVLLAYEHTPVTLYLGSASSIGYGYPSAIIEDMFTIPKGYEANPHQARGIAVNS